MTTQWEIAEGDSLEVLRTLRPECIDALVTDPPAGISFMNKTWDHDHGGRAGWIAALTPIFVECLRVLKPGAHGLVWAIPRTSHWTASALEDAGFEIRDVITHLNSQGFPKSLNVGEGRGTALKPASEHWILVRKPLTGTVAENIQAHGTGALNVDGCRIEGAPRTTHKDGNHQGSAPQPMDFSENATGRWPANLVLSCCGEDPHVEGCPVAELDAQSGELSSGSRAAGVRKGRGFGSTSLGDGGPAITGSSGGASRFFYTAKPSKRERGEGNNHPTVKPVALMRYLCRLITPPGGLVLDPFAGSGTTGIAALAEGFSFLGIEREAAYADIARSRLTAGLPA